MLCQDIINILENQSPTEYALEWDNVGLLVGRRNKEIHKLLLAVDATKEVCQAAIDGGYDMVVTHHPMIFSKMKKINDDTILGDKILSLIEAGIACYAMHTNFDTIGGMGKMAADMLNLKNTEVLEETLNGEGIGRIGVLDNKLTLGDLADLVKTKFGLKNVLLYGNKGKIVDKIGICPGSGKSVIDISVKKGVECLITGDIGHHDGIDAVDEGLSIIDATHYGIEKIFMDYMKGYISDRCPQIQIDTYEVGVPFEVI